MPTKEDLKYLQSMPLDIKVALTRQRIREWITYYGENGVYISFSGGKDSTVLLDIVRKDYPRVEAVFVDTGLEYPEVKHFVRTFDGVTILRPKMTFRQVIEKYGYPLITKEISGRIANLRNPNYRGISDLLRINGEHICNGKKSPFNCEKYKPLLYVDFMISDRCCDRMKKSPIKSYEKTSGKVPITAQMTEESRLRYTKWLKHGCNMWDNKRPISNPMSFWTENDVLRYIFINGLQIASVYGNIVPANDQLEFGEPRELCTTGCKRTGCVFCGFGCHLEKGETRFQRLKRTHPKLYSYCIFGGGYAEDGLWKPTDEGLGMKHVFDVLNSIYGEGFIRYE